MEADIYQEIVRLRAAGQSAALATIIEVRGSIPSHETAKLLVREDGSMVGTIGGGCVEADVWQAAREVMREEKSRRMTFHLNNAASYDSGLICGGTLEVFIEPIPAPPLVVIFGAGHVSLSLSKVAVAAGFSTIIADDRERFASPERFPEARAVHAAEYEAVFPQLPVTRNSYIVIVTRGHRDDMRVLKWAVTTPARYIGMIGSRRKVLSTYQELEKEGMDAKLFERVHAPMGLRIGAQTPEEIAVATVAELIAARRGVGDDLPRMSDDTRRRWQESHAHESAVTRKS